MAEQRFCSYAFYSEEIGEIAAKTVTVDKNTAYSTDSGNDTEAKVFLLSILEKKKYFADNEVGKCVPIAYIKVQCVYTNDNCILNGKSICWLWLWLSGYDRSAAGFIV